MFKVLLISCLISKWISAQKLLTLPVCGGLKPGMKVKFSVINNLNEWDITLFNNLGAKCNGSVNLEGAEVSLNIREHRVHSMYPWHSESYGFGWGRYGHPFRDYQYSPLRTKRGEEVQGEIAVTRNGFDYRVNGRRVHGVRFHYPNLLTDCVAFEANVTMTFYWIEGNDDCKFRSNDKPDPKKYPRKTSTILQRRSTKAAKPTVRFSNGQSLRTGSTKFQASNERLSTTTKPFITTVETTTSGRTYPCPSGIKMIEGRRLPRNCEVGKMRSAIECADGKHIETGQVIPVRCFGVYGQ